MKKLLAIAFLLVCQIAWAAPKTGSGSITVRPSAGAAVPAANNVPNFANAGLALIGGMPTRSTQCGSTVNPIGGTSDDYTNIQNALNACTAGQVVQLGSGTFNVTLADLPVHIGTGITLRGTGSCTGNISAYPAGLCSSQIIVRDGLQPYLANGPQCGVTSGSTTQCPNGGEPVILVAPAAISPSYNWGWNGCANPGGSVGTGCGATLVTSDAAQGDTTIHVASTSNFTVGDWVLIDESSGAYWQTDPDTANTGFGRIWAAPDFTTSGPTPVTGRVVWSKGETLPGAGGFNWDFPTSGVSAYPYQTASVGCYPFNYCDRPTSEIHKISSIGTGTITFDDPVTIAYRVAGPNSFTGHISGTTLIVDSGTPPQGAGVSIGGAGVSPGTYIVSGTGPFTVTNSQTISSEAMTWGAHNAQVYGPVFPNHSGTAPKVALLEQAGVENLTVLRGPNGMITFELCAYCWAKNVEAGEFYNGGITVQYSARVELNTVYIHHSWDSVNSGGEYPISCDGASTEILITNYITNFAGKGMVARAGCAGSVISYGYQDDTMYDKFSGIGNYFIDMGVNASHYSGPHHVLFEGNWGDNLDSDSTHGNSVYITFFRNQGTGLRTPFTDPSTSSGVNDFSGTGQACTGAGSCSANAPSPLRAAGPMAYNYQFAFVGNTLGLATKTTTGNSWTYQGDWNAHRIWMLGWWNFGTGGNDPNLTGTNGTYITRSCNYDYVNASIQTCPMAGLTSSLPNSLYLPSAGASKPPFFTAGFLTYPWPQVTPQSSPFVQVNSASGSGLPAKARWDAGTPFVQP